MDCIRTRCPPRRCSLIFLRSFSMSALTFCWRRSCLAGRTSRKRKLSRANVNNRERTGHHGHLRVDISQDVE